MLMHQKNNGYGQVLIVTREVVIASLPQKVFGFLKLLPCKEESCQISWWLKVKVLTLACHFAILNSQLSLWQSNNGKFPKGYIFHPLTEHTYALQLINQVSRHHVTQNEMKSRVVF